MTKNSKRIEDRLKERLNVLNQDESNFGCSLGQQSQVKGPLINATAHHILGRRRHQKTIEVRRFGSSFFKYSTKRTNKRIITSGR